MNQLLLLLRNRVALIGIGAVVVALVGAAVVGASGGHLLGIGAPAQCASENIVSAHTSSTPTGDRDESGEQSASGHKVHGEGHQCSGDDHDGDHDNDHDGTSGTRTPSAHSGD